MAPLKAEQGDRLKGIFSDLQTEKMWDFNSVPHGFTMGHGRVLYLTAWVHLILWVGSP